MLKQCYKQVVRFINKDSRNFMVNRLLRKQIKKAIPSSTSIDREYKKQIDYYWSSYNKKICKDWHYWYSTINNKKDVKYIPEDLFYTQILPFFNELQFKHAYCDKSILDIWFPNVATPKTIVKNMSGNFFDESHKPITKSLAISKCLFEKKVIIKPSIDSGGGRDVELINPLDSNLMQNEIITALSKFKENFVIQTVIKQHMELNKINPSSVNTIRVMSFAFKNEIHILSSVLRMGISEAVVDNQGAGGISCAISKDGKLKEFAYGKDGHAYEKHPKGYIFKNKNVPSYNEIINIVKREHTKFGHFALISWDFAIDELGAPILIEFNLGYQEINFHQLGNGPLFGDLTEEILQEVFGRR